MGKSWRTRITVVLQRARRGEPFAPRLISMSQTAMRTIPGAGSASVLVVVGPIDSSYDCEALMKSLGFLFLMASVGCGVLVACGGDESTSSATATGSATG